MAGIFWGLKGMWLFAFVETGYKSKKCKQHIVKKERTESGTEERNNLHSWGVQILKL